MLKNIKLVFFIFALCFSIGCNLFAGTAFNLTVLDENQSPIQNAAIKGGCGNGGINGKTNENGKFTTTTQCAFDEGFYFSVEKDGYLKYSETLRPAEFFQYNQFKDKRIILKK